MGNFRKRGQITIFIILGIVILMGSAGYFYIKQKTSNFEPNTLELRKTTALHPFVETCLEQKTREALGIIGSTGGYLEFPMEMKLDPASYLKLAPFDEAKMPYWWYKGEIRIIPLDDEDNYWSIKSQTERYVENNIDECIDNFSSINGYDVYKTGDIDVIITFAENDIDVKLKYPIRAVKVPELNEFQLNEYDFFVKVPIRFRKMYELATKIMESENKDYFMEHFTMDLIALDDTGEKESTPLTNFDFRLKPYSWNIKTIKSELQEILYRNIQYIRFNKTEFTPFPDTMPYMQVHNSWNFDYEPENNYPNMRVAATYDQNWPTRLDISPTKGGALRSGNTMVGGYLSFIGIQTWHFNYDISYPVKITIQDDGDRNTDPYTFSYAFIVSIKSNRPYRQNYGTRIFETNYGPDQEEACDYLTQNFDTRVTINTLNAFTSKPIPKVNITFTCIRYTCPMGKTELTSNGASAGLTTNFPYCPGAGILEGHKEGYEDVTKIVTLSQNANIDLPMKPVQTITNYTLVKHLYIGNTRAGQETGREENLFENEQAVILISSGQTQTQYASLPSNESLPLKFYKDEATRYNITIYLFKSDYTDDEGSMIGAYEYEFQVDPSVVKESNYIKFHVLEYPAKSDEELGLFLAGIKSYSQKIPQPEFMKIE